MVTSWSYKIHQREGRDCSSEEIKINTEYNANRYTYIAIVNSRTGAVSQPADDVSNSLSKKFQN